MTISPPLACFEPANVANGYARPWMAANAWLPDRSETAPVLMLTWPQPQKIRTIEITFDTDFDHPMESVLMGHPERLMPGCITDFEIRTAEGTVLAHIHYNHQTRFQLALDRAVETTGISIAVLAHGPALPAIYEVRCY
jgi:hypothetical protein